MLPRSDKVYVWLTVAAAGAVVIISLIAAANALFGHPKPRPAYESAPAASLVPPPNHTIVNIDNALRPYISDGDYEYLHRNTRVAPTALLADGWEQAAQKLHATPAATRALRNGMREYRSWIRGMRPSRAESITVNRPVNDQTRTGAIVRYNGTDSDGNPLTPTIVSFDLYWQRDGASWRLFDVKASLTGGQQTGSASDPTDSGLDGADDLDQGSSGPKIVVGAPDSGTDGIN